MSRMLRPFFVACWLLVALTIAVKAQEMKLEPKQFRLAGRVESVETRMIEETLRTYRILHGVISAPKPFGEPSKFSPENPLLCEALKFNADGKLVEDFDLERTEDQDPYKYVYGYNTQGLISERTSYRENGSIEATEKFIYNPGGKKIEERSYSAQGQFISRSTFDDNEQPLLVEFYDENGAVRPNGTYRYEYVKKGNVLEQTYFAPHGPAGTGMEVTSTSTKDNRPTDSRFDYRTLFVYDNQGRLREKSRYLPDGSLLEREVFDEHETMRDKEFRLGEMMSTISTFDAKGNEIESHSTAKGVLSSPGGVDDRTIYSYDAYGNQTKMTTKAPDDSLVQETTTEIEYDSHANWIKKKETKLNYRWQTEPYPVAFETISLYRRVIRYFPEQ
jgi:hypothetical protein